MMDAQVDPRRAKLEREGKIYIVRDHFAVVVHLALLLSSARTLTWNNAFVVAGIMFLIKATTAAVCVRINPAVLNARGTKREMSRSEKMFFSVLIPSSLALPLVAGFDVGASGWTHVSLVELGVGVGLMGLGGAITIGALAVNAFFEPTVRIQNDRGHQVCTSGPYRLVRHPGYLGVMMFVLAVPLIVGSRWAFIPAALQCIALVVRTASEDRLLHDELPGYTDYAKSTRFRLFPPIW